MPAAIDLEAVIGLLLDRSAAVPIHSSRNLGFAGRKAGAMLPRPLIARSAPPSRLIAVAASDRAVEPLEDATIRTRLARP